MIWPSRLDSQPLILDRRVSSSMGRRIDRGGYISFRRLKGLDVQAD